MEVECPKCYACIMDVDEELPNNACDDAETECPECDHVFTIGWVAEAEVRDNRLNT